MLAARGYRYDSSYADDDRPYIVANGDGNRLVELPVHEPWTDKPYYEKHRVPRVVAASFLDEFDATYGVGGLFTLAVRPRGDYGSGRGARVRALEPLLRALREHPAHLGRHLPRDRRMDIDGRPASEPAILSCIGVTQLARVPRWRRFLGALWATCECRQVANLSHRSFLTRTA